MIVEGLQETVTEPETGNRVTTAVATATRAPATLVQIGEAAETVSAIAAPLAEADPATPVHSVEGPEDSVAATHGPVVLVAPPASQDHAAEAVVAVAAAVAAEGGGN